MATATTTATATATTTATTATTATTVIAAISMPHGHDELTSRLLPCRHQVRWSDIALRAAQHGPRRAADFSVGALRVEDRLQQSAAAARGGSGSARALRLMDSNPSDSLTPRPASERGQSPKETHDQLVRLATASLLLAPCTGEVPASLVHCLGARSSHR